MGKESVSMEHKHATTDDITVRGRTEYFLETIILSIYSIEQSQIRNQSVRKSVTDLKSTKLKLKLLREYHALL